MCTNKQSKPKTLLIFAPYWEPNMPNMPYLAGPALASYLRNHNYPVDQWDVNLSFFNQVFDSQYLTRKVEERRNILEKQQANIPQILEFLPEINRAKNIFKTKKEFYQSELLEEANEIWLQTCEILMLLYPTSKITPLTFEMQERYTSSAEVLKATQNRMANPFIEYYEEFVLPAIEKNRPDLIGFTISLNNQVIPTFTLSTLIKKHFPDIHISIGGAYFSKFADGIKVDEHIAFQHFIDSAVKGEGEDPLLKLVQAVGGEIEFEEVPGLIYSNGEGQVLVNENGAAVPMRAIWEPDFDGLDLSGYWTPDLIFPILGSRDCYWKDCAFCDHYMQYAFFRSRKPATIVEDLDKLHKKYGVKHFLFVDETMSPKYGRLMADEIEKRNLDLHWFTMARLEKGFTLETSQRWREAGCIYVMMGLESASPELAKNMVKGTDNSITETVYRNLSDAGIFTFAFLFFGFPGESFKTAKETVDFIKKHKDILHSTASNVFSLKKNSPMYKNLDDYNIINLHPEDLSDDWATSVRCEVAGGLAFDDAFVIDARFKEALWDIYNGPFWMGNTSRISIFLYLSHYGRDWMLEQSWMDPDDKRLKQAQQMHNQGDLIQAEQAYQAILAKNPQHIVTLNSLGYLYFQKQEIQKAYTIFQQVLQMDNRFPEALLTIGQCHHFQGNLDQARHFYMQAIDLDQYLAQAYYRIAQTLVPPGSTQINPEKLKEALYLCNEARGIKRCDETIGTLTLFNCEGLEQYEESLLRIEQQLSMVS